MATYGPDNGTVPFTGYTPTLGVGSATIAATSGRVARNGLSNDDFHIAGLFNRRSSRRTKELLITLLGTSAGSTASDSYGRAHYPPRNLDAQEYGGLRARETVSIVNRATAAGDVTAITALLNREPKPSTYAADASGNGGGGKAGF